MKLYKAIDFFLQVSLLFSIVISLLFIDVAAFDSSFLLLGFVAVQVISLFINGIAGVQYWKIAKWRKIHAIGTRLVLVLLLVAFFQGSIVERGSDKDDKYRMDGLSTLFFSLIPAVVMALFYTIITGKEWLNTKHNK